MLRTCGLRVADRSAQWVTYFRPGTPQLWVAFQEQWEMPVSDLLEMTAPLGVSREQLEAAYEALYPGP